MNKLIGNNGNKIFNCNKIQVICSKIHKILYKPLMKLHKKISNKRLGNEFQKLPNHGGMMNAMRL
jgi:hypothetical protein